MFGIRLATLTCLLAVAGVGRARAEAPATALADDKPAPMAVKAPATLAEIAKRRQALQEETKEAGPLQLATRPATTQPLEPTTQPSDVATNLWLLLQTYDQLLLQQELARARLKSLRGDEGISKLKDELDKLQSETKQLEQRLTAGKAREEAYRAKEFADLHEKHSQEVNALVKTQTAREERINTFADQRKEITAKIAEARKQRDETIAQFAVRTTTAKAGPERDQIDYERRLAELKLELRLAEAETLNVEEELLTEERQRDARRIAAQQPYVEALRQWANALKAAVQEDKRSQIEQQLRQAKTEYEKIYWQAAKEIDEAYDAFEPFTSQKLDRFPKSELAELEATIAAAQKYWRTFLDSLPLRTGQEVLSRYKESRARLVQRRQYRKDLVGRLEKSVRDRESVVALREKVRETVDDFRDELAKVASKVGDEEAAKLESKLSKARLDLFKHIDAIATNQIEVIDRLTDAIGKHRDFLNEFEKYRSRLYWSYLAVRDEGLARVDWQKLRSEWADGAQPLESRLSVILEEALAQLRQASGPRWACAAIFLGVAAYLAWRLYRSMTGRANRYEASLGEKIQEEGIEVAGIGERLKLACLHFAGDTPLLLVSLVGLLLAVVALGLREGPFYLVASAVLFVAAARFLFGVVHALFLPARPRFRVVRCSNKVASYYRRWSNVLLCATIFAVPLPLLLGLLDVMPATRAYLWQVYKSVALLIIMLFFLQKQRVLKVVGRPENLRARWLYTLVASLYPLIVFGTLSLLVLEVIGYGALVSYLGWNTILTFSILLGVTLVTSFVTDVAWKLRQSATEKRLAQEANAEPAQPSGAPRGTAAAQEVVVADEGVPADSEYLIVPIASLLKWVARAAGLVLVLYVWGVTPVELKAAFNLPFIGRPVWRVFAAGASIVVSVVLSRSMRSVLRRRVYPAYKATLDQGARAAVNTMLHYFLVALGIYTAMQFLEIHLGAFAFLLGTLGLGLGLGLQPLFINFISGLMIYFERHIKVGDVVEVGDKLGEVTAIRMRSTSIKTYDNIDMVIPNGEFITTQVTNWTLQDQRLRAHLDVGVAYGSDVELVREILLQIADEHPKVLKDPAPKVWFTDFGDSALMFKLLIWCADVTDRYTSLTDLRFALNREFKEHGITIPFPQRTLSTVGDEPLPVKIAGTSSDPNAVSDPSQGH